MSTTLEMQDGLQPSQERERETEMIATKVKDAKLETLADYLNRMGLYDKYEELKDAVLKACDEHCAAEYVLAKKQDALEEAVNKLEALRASMPAALFYVD